MVRLNMMLLVNRIVLNVINWLWLWNKWNGMMGFLVVCFMMINVIVVVKVIRFELMVMFDI